MSEPVFGVKFGDDGLVVAIAQDRLDGRVLMVAYMNREALEITLRTKRVTFWSRSRQSLWTKGETSGNVLDLVSLHLDCDGDALVVLVDPRGPSCHTGAETCFFREELALPQLVRLAREIESRKSSDASKSYTRSLLDGGAPRIGGKLREEADELARALEGESDERVASEAADVIYHLMVGLSARGLSFTDALRALARREGTSGHEEKQLRGK